MAGPLNFDAYLGWVDITDPANIPQDARVISASDLLRYEQLGLDTAEKFAEVDTALEGLDSDEVIASRLSDGTSLTRAAVQDLVDGSVTGLQETLDAVPGQVDAKLATDVPPAVAAAIGADGTVAAAAASAVQSEVQLRALVASSDPRMAQIMHTKTLLAAFFDSLGNETWLGARNTDGGPSDWAMHHLHTRLGISLGASPGYLATLTDSEGLLTDLAIRASDGQFADFVIQRLAPRLAPLLGITGQSDPEPASTVDGSTPALVPLLQSIANAAGRHADGAALPANPTSFTANGEAARLTFPTRYSNATPVPLIIQFEGVADRSLDPRSAYLEPVKEAGALYGKCNFHGDSYGSPNAMADARALYEYALRIAPISGVILMGNSMGGAGALNALTTGTIPNVLGVYLTDPVTDLRQRYDNGRMTEIKTAYGIAADGSDYAAKTAGHDPALAPIESFRGVPIKAVHSSTDASVPMALHVTKLFERLGTANDTELINTGVGTHNSGDRFIPAELVEFITKVSGGTVGLRA